MYKILSAIFFFCLFCSQSKAQIFPGEASALNYRIIGFSFPSKQEISKYKIEIAIGTYYNDDSFKKNIITSFTSDTNRIIGEVPAFGKEYTWRLVYIKNNAKKNSELRHFRTLIIPDVDTNITRLSILKPAEEYKDAYIFLDATRTLYDMNGSPLWFVPNDTPYVNMSGKDSSFSHALDIKLTPQGTITFMNYNGLFEINYNGQVLWKIITSIPEGMGKSRFNQYHHEFTRLSNGHYMALGAQIVFCKPPALKDTGFQFVYRDRINRNKDTSYKKIRLEELLEYDEKSNLVWSWQSLKYIQGSDLFSAVKNGYITPDLHSNAFYFDEQNQTIYISFRDISRIIKIKYPEENVLNTYGGIYTPGVKNIENKLFCEQHSCRRSQDGYLYLFNNNSCNKDSLSSIVIMQEPPTPDDTLKKIWEYKCNMSDDGSMQVNSLSATGAGSVMELPGHSILACMGGDYSKVFIVNMDKKILWSATIEKWSNGKRKWDMVASYRANMITGRKELERLIWNAIK